MHTSLQSIGIQYSTKSQCTSPDIYVAAGSGPTHTTNHDKTSIEIVIADT